MHLGLSGNPADRHQAEKLSAYLLQKIPNSILNRASPRPEVRSTTLKGFSMEGVADALLDKEASRKQVQHQQSPSALKRKAFAVHNVPDEDKGDEKDLDKNAADISIRFSAAQSPSSPNLNQYGKKQIKTTELPIKPKFQTCLHAVSSKTSLLVDNINQLESSSMKSSPSKYSFVLPETTFPSDLYELFTNSKYLMIRKSTLSEKDCEAIYQKLYSKGITTSDRLMNYLKETKQFQNSLCSCPYFTQYYQIMVTGNIDETRVLTNEDCRSDGRKEGGDSDDEYSIPRSTIVNYRNYSSLHSSYCPNRLCSCWMSSLEKLDISTIHAYQLISFMKPYLP
jgi:hypothetical protein